MTSTRCLLIIIFLIINRFSFGQEEDILRQEKSNSVQVNFGLLHIRMMDQGYTHSRLIFRGTNGQFGLGYNRETTRGIFNFSAVASFGKLKSKSGNLPSDFVFMHPSLSYLRRIKEYVLLDRVNIFNAGVSLSSLTYFLENEPVIDNIDIFSLHGIYFNFNNRLRLNSKQNVQLTYLMPVAVYQNRVLWNSGASDLTYSDKEKILRTLTTRGESSYFDIIGNIQFSAMYLVSLTSVTYLGIQYKFFFLNGFDEAPIRAYSNEVLVGLKFNF